VVVHKKGKRHDYDIIKRIILSLLKKEVVNVFDLGYLGVKKLSCKTNIIAILQKEKNHKLSKEDKE
jgi:hypothetical protein